MIMVQRQRWFPSSLSYLGLVVLLVISSQQDGLVAAAKSTGGEYDGDAKKNSMMMMMKMSKYPYDDDGDAYYLGYGDHASKGKRRSKKDMAMMMMMGAKSAKKGAGKKGVIEMPSFQPTRLPTTPKPVTAGPTPQPITPGPTRSPATAQPVATMGPTPNPTPQPTRPPTPNPTPEPTTPPTPGPTGDPTTPPSQLPSSSPTETFQVAFWEYGYTTQQNAPESLGGAGNGNLVSGTKINGAGGAPLQFVPHLGCSAMAPYTLFPDAVTGEFVPDSIFCLSIGNYGNRSNSPDYPVHVPQIVFGTGYEFGPESNGILRYETRLVFDREGRLLWENNATVAISMFVPDQTTWGDVLAGLQVVAGADFGPQAIVLTDPGAAILADGYSPIMIPLDISGLPIVAFPFIRIPDITPSLELNPSKFVIGEDDKSFCDLAALETGTCQFGGTVVTDYSSVIPESEFTIIQGGFGGMALVNDVYVAGFFMLVQGTEPGVRVYQITPGLSQNRTQPSVSDFMGFYSLEPGFEFVSDVSTVPGSSSIVFVVESEVLPSVSAVNDDTRFIYCFVDLASANSEGVFDKRCIIDNDEIYDRLNTSSTSGESSPRPVRGGGMLILDENCFVASADSNFPISETARLELGLLMLICFPQPMFSDSYLISSVFS